MGGKSSQSTQTVSIPPEVLARYNAVNARAEQVASTPFQQYSTDPSAFVAPLTSTQQSGIANTNAAANMAQPYYGAATGYALAGGEAVNPEELNVQQYMNPFLGTVVGNTAALLGQENQQAMSGQTGNAIRQGAFGGDRAGIAAANLARQQNMAFGNTIGNLLYQGYGQALGTAQQQQGVGLGAEQANRQALQQTAASLAGLGAGAQTAGLQGAQAQLAAGQVEQGTEQAGKTALYNQFLQKQSYPFQVAQFLGNIAMGTGALSGSTTTGSSSISDRRAKHDVHEIGRTFDGQPIYNFKYNGDDRTQIGLMAQDVERMYPEAVGLAGGMKTVDYDKATRGAAHRGHFAAGGLAGSSQGGMVDMGHMGEGYADGGMIAPMSYGSSPFIGYDPTAAFQSLYGGLLGLGGGSEGGVGGIGIPTGPTSHGELAVAKMEQPQMPDMAAQADKWASLGKNIYGLGKDVSGMMGGSEKPEGQGPTFGDPIDVGRRVEDSWDYNEDGSHKPHFGGGHNPDGSMSYAPFAHGGLIGGMRHGYATAGAIPYGGAAESIVPDEKPGERKLLQADPSSMPNPQGGGLGGILGGLGKLASFIPGVGTAIGKGLGAAGSISSGLGFAYGGDVGDDTEEQRRLEAAGMTDSAPETYNDTPIEVMAPPRAIEGIVGEAPKIEPLETPDLNMPKPRTFLDGLGQVVDIGSKIGSKIAGMADGGEVEEDAFSHNERSLKMLMDMINKNYREENPEESDLFQHSLYHPSDIDAKFSKMSPQMDPEPGLGMKPISPAEKRMPFEARPAPTLAPPGGSLFKKIMHGEGTDKFSNPYDVVYGANPRTGLSPYANPEGRLSSMPIGAVQDFQRELIAATRGKVKGVSPDKGTGAVGAYQFTRDTLADLARRIYGPDWKSVPFSPEVQDRLAAQLVKERPDLSGTFAAFADGPQGGALRAQRGYAFGGLVGRNGYAGDGAVTGEPENLLPEDMQDFSVDRMDQIVSGARARGYVTPEEQARLYRAAPDQTARNNLVALQQKEGLNTVANEPERVPQRASGSSYVDQDAGSGGKHRRGFLGDILHGDFISGLGKGKADSWIPLIAGIGASMSGPYRGIVGLGQGLAAGAKTAQGMREFQRQEAETGIRQQLATTAAANVPISQQLANARTAEQIDAVRQNIRNNLILMQNTGVGVSTNPEYTRMQSMLTEADKKMRSVLGFTGGVADPKAQVMGTPDLTKPFAAQQAAVGFAAAGLPGAASIYENVATAGREGRILTPGGLIPTPGYGSTVGGNAASVTGAQEATIANAKIATNVEAEFANNRDNVWPIIKRIGEIPETGPGRNQISNLAAAVRVLVQAQGGDVSKIDANDPASVINAAGTFLNIPGLNAGNPTAATRAIVATIRTRIINTYKAARAVDEYKRKNRNPLTDLPDYSRGDLNSTIIKAIAGD